MIDIDFQKIPYQDISEMSLLILQNGDNNYCTAARDWSDVIQEYHKNTRKVNYKSLYSTRGFEGTKKYLHDYIDKNNVSIVYFDSPVDHALDITFLGELRKKAFMMIAFDDTALFFDDWFRYQCQAFDLILSHDYVEKYRFALFGTKSLFFPQISNLKDFYDLDVDSIKKDILISFVGRTDRIGRKEFLDHLEKNNVAVELYGEGTKNGMITAEQKIDIYKRSKISLNFSGCAEYFHDKGVKKIDKRIKQVKGRIWELVLCKTLVITDYAPCLERSFNIGEEIVIFEDERDMLEKVRYYMQNDAERERIALNGLNRARRDVNYREIVKNLLQLIYKYAKEKKYHPNEIILDDDYLKSVSIRRVISAVNFLKHKKYRLACEELDLIIRSRKVNIIESLWAIFKEIFRPVVKNNNTLSKIALFIRKANKFFVSY